MERWRIFAVTALASIVFLVALYAVTEAGRERLRHASEQMHGAMQRRALVGRLREQVAEASLASRSFLLTGGADRLDLLRATGLAIDDTAQALVRQYDDGSAIATTARMLRELAGVQAEATARLVTLQTTHGVEAARELAQLQAASDPLRQFVSVARRLERHEDARVRQTRDAWLLEQVRARWIGLAGMLVTVLVVLGASLMAAATLRRHSQLLAQIAARKEELEGQAVARTAEINEIYGHLQTVQEQERSRLARGLHDELGGLLLAARMDATWVRQHAGDSTSRAFAARLDRMVDVLDQGIDLKRRVIEELRPTLLDNMGLLAALRWQVGESCRRARIECACHFPAEEPVAAPQTAIAVFRVLQEALTNVHRHALAQHVDVTLDVAGDHLLLAVVDDGCGIPAGAVQRPGAHGLVGMKHRIAALGGTLTVGRSPEGGTEVRVLVPRGPLEHATGSGAESRSGGAPAHDSATARRA